MNFRRFLTRLCISLLVLIAAYFLFRNTFLEWAFARMQVRSEKNYGISLSTANVHFSGIDRVHFKKLVVQPLQADTLVIIDELDCNLSISDLLRGRLGFDEIHITGSTTTIYNQRDRNNLKFISLNKSRETNLASAGKYLEHKNNWKEKFLHAFNTSYHLKDMHICYTDSNLTENILLPALDYDLQALSALIINQHTGDSISLSGSVLKKNKSYQFSISQIGEANEYLPFFDRERSLKCRFRSVKSVVTLNDHNDELELSTEFEATNFQLNHWRIAKGDVTFPYAQLNAIWHIRNDAIELDSNSVVNLSGVPFRLFARYTVKPDEALALHIHMPETISDSAFHALPEGIFQTLNGISCTGTLSFDLQFSIDAKQPDSLCFSTSLNRKNFRLNHFGAENYTRINDVFIYNAFDKEHFIRQIIVGPANPMFTPLSRMSDYLPKAVLQSEDPSFMQHRGFLPEAFRESIIQNYKEKRFARGGSTISMQLVKNIFLSRDKTLSRKAEEALIVYLIENLGLVSKERMLEIYLNIIEWGPDVYGIGEAAGFYFNKRPAELTLQESIFLASLIPAPKYFKYRFDKQGNLNPYMFGYFRIIVSRMAGKGWISSVDTAGFHPEVRLRGPARNLIMPPDSMRIEEQEDF